MTGSAAAPQAIQFDRRFLIAAAVVLAGAFFVPRAYLFATLAIAIALIVLSPLPRGTRGLVLSTMIGLATGIAALNLFTVPLFEKPLLEEFGWERTEYWAVIPIGTLIVVLSSPIIGQFCDRYGVRRITLPSIVLLALSFGSLYFLTPNVWHLYIVFALIPILGAGTSSVAYSRVITWWFDGRRGQALGTALAGIGIGGAVLSTASQQLIGSFGWRGAYAGLGLLVLLTLPLMYALLRDSPAEKGLGQDGLPMDRTSVALKPELIGMTGAEARRTLRFWMMFAGFTILGFGIGGAMLQLVPVLRSSGLSPAQAAEAQQALGIALIMGRAFAGFLMDRIFAPYVAVFFVLFPIAGVLLLANGASGSGGIVAAMMIGLAAGAELDVIAYLVSRYFGSRAYAENYGWQYVAWTIGSGSAPLTVAAVAQHYGSYTPAMLALAVVFAVSCVVIARLGPYPDFARTPPASRVTAATSSGGSVISP